MPLWYVLLPAYFSFTFYIGGIAARLHSGQSPWAYLVFRLFWFTGAILLVLHSALAFVIVHHADHAAAYEHVARRTAELTGWNSGAGLYANEAMLGVWLIDSLWALLSPGSYLSRPAAIDWPVHFFFAFMFFFATIVFGSLSGQTIGAIGLLLVGVAIQQVFVLPARRRSDED